MKQTNKKNTPSEKLQARFNKASRDLRNNHGKRNAIERQRDELSRAIFRGYYNPRFR